MIDCEFEVKERELWRRSREDLTRIRSERDTLIEALKQCVVALESKWAANWDGHYSGKGITKEYAKKVSEEITNATSHAKSVLEKYK